MLLIIYNYKNGANRRFGRNKNIKYGDMLKEEVLQQLKEIATELGVDLYDDRVLIEYSERYRGMPSDIADEIFPMYYDKEQAKPCYQLKSDKNGNAIAYQQEKDGEWIYFQNQPSSSSE